MSEQGNDKQLGSLSPSPESDKQAATNQEQEQSSQQQNTQEQETKDNTENADNSSKESEYQTESVQSNGIPHVAAKAGTNNGKPSNLSKILFGLLLLVILIGLGFLIAYKLGFLSAQNEEVAPYEASQDDLSNTGSLTANQSYTTVALPPPPEVTAPEPEVKEEEVKEPPKEMPLPVPAALGNAGAVDAQGNPLPTLEELKFAAPMMGNAGDAMGSNRGSGGSGGSYGATPVGPVTAGGFGAGESNSTPTLGDMLEPVHTPSKTARVIKNQSLTLSKGTVIDCILETKVDTTVPGMTSCVVPRNIFSMDGRTLLIEKGTKAIGEYQGSVKNGLARIFMLWTELRTPNGVAIAINSPTTDHLGGAGMGGYVDYHWWQRFGNALLFSMVSDGFQYVVNNANRNNNNGDITYNNTSDGVDEIIKEAMAQSGNIPPTLVKNQGERVAIFVARDLNFSSVYSLSKQ